MEQNYLLKTAFLDIDRWDRAIEHALKKGIPRVELTYISDPKFRAWLYMEIRDGKYKIGCPRTAKIPKDTPGEFRTVYINSDLDRIILFVLNELLFEKYGHMVHKNCKSYQKGISVGKTVTELSKCIENWKEYDGHVGFKADLSKYFDSVPIEYIDWAFDRVEDTCDGSDALIQLVRDYYHDNSFYDTENHTDAQKYQSLKQGCAVASWLADVILQDVDDVMSSQFSGTYIRYCDDIIYVGTDWSLAYQTLSSMLERKQLVLNPKKVELIDKNHWVTFLGFSIRGKDITLSKKYVTRFKNEIRECTLKRKQKMTVKEAISATNRVLYRGYKDYSWATQTLNVINVEHDINELNNFVMDAVRAAVTGHKHIGGLGYRKEQRDGVIQRGTGRNVKANREKIASLDGYMTISCMRNALLTSKGAYETIVRTVLL